MPKKKGEKLKTKDPKKTQAKAKSKDLSRTVENDNDNEFEESVEEIELNTPNNTKRTTRGRQPKSDYEIDALLTDVALKPDGITFEKIGQKYGIHHRQLYEIRQQHAEAIKQKQQDYFTEHKANVIKSLLLSCEGFSAKTPKGNYQHPPNPKSIELFFGLEGANNKILDSDPYRIYDEFYPLSKQAQFIYSGNPLGKFTTNYLISGIAYGKTAAIVEKAIILARRNRRRIGMIVAPTYKMLQHPVLEYMLSRLNQLNIKYKHRKADGELELWGDTTILLRSADNPDNLRGPTIAWLIGDELRNWDKSALDICLGRVRDPNARDRQAAFTTTPDGFNWIYDLVQGDKAEQMKADGMLNVFYARTEDNPFLPADFIDMVRNSYDTDFASQELEGKFLPVGTGTIFHCFNRAVNIKDVEFDPAYPVWIGQDFNVNPLASVLMQPVKLQNGLTEVRVFDELAIRNASVDDLIKELKLRGFPPDYRGELHIYPDATAWNRNVSAAKSPLTQLKDAGYDIISPRGNPLTRDRYAAVNGKLRNSNGVTTLYINKRCQNLIKDLEREVYKEGSNSRETSRDGAATRGHHSDALGYPIHNEFRIETAFMPARLA